MISLMNNSHAGNICSGKYFSDDESLQNKYSDYLMTMESAFTNSLKWYEIVSLLLIVIFYILVRIKDKHYERQNM